MENEHVFVEYYPCAMSLANLIPAKNRSPGLTAFELERAQEEAGAAFPPDLAEFLMDCLPVGSTNPRRPPDLRPVFPDWRNNAAEAMSRWRDELLGGAVFDVEHGLWVEEWGVRPNDPQEVRARVAEVLDNAPPLIPIFAHRAIPNEPLEAGNPVFSVKQFDIIVYGNDLEQYLHNEFARPPLHDETGRLLVDEEGRLLHDQAWRGEGSPREIRFWTRAMDFWDDEFWDEELAGESG
jgi:hypothetical protein